MEYYLVFDGSCSECRSLAATIETMSYQVKPISIRSEEAVALLNQAFPDGWRHVPYLLKVEDGKVCAWKGMSMILRLLPMLGVQGSWQTWQAIRRKNVSILSIVDSSLASVSRRQTLKTGVGIGLAAILAKVFGVSVFETKTAYAAFCPFSSCSGVGYVTNDITYCSCSSANCGDCQGCNKDKVREVTCFFQSCGYRVGYYITCNQAFGYCCCCA